MLDLVWIFLIIWSAGLIIDPGKRVNKDKLPKGKTYDEVIKMRSREGIITLILSVLFMLFL